MDRKKGKPCRHIYESTTKGLAVRELEKTRRKLDSIILVETSNSRELLEGE